MPTRDEILQEQIRRERVKRETARRQPQQGENYTEYATRVQPKALQGQQPPGLGVEAGGIGQTVDDLTRQFGEGYTYNWGNRLTGGTPEQLQAARDRTGWAGTGAEVAGALASPSIVARMPMLAFKGAKTLAHGVGGAAEGALASYGRDEPWSQIGQEALKGGGITAAISKVASPVSNWIQRRKNRRAQQFKTNEDLTRSRKEDYDIVDKSGAVFRNRDLRQLHAQLKNTPTTPGTDEHTRVQALLKKFETEWRGKDITPSQLDDLRAQVTKNMSATKTSRTFGEDMVSAMDKFSRNTPVHIRDPNTGAYKPASSVNAALVRARDKFSREQRVKAAVRMERQAQRLHTTGRQNPFGASLESARIKRYGKLKEQIEEGKTKTSPFTKPEEKLVSGLEQGTFRRNVGGWAEHLSPSGSLLGKASVALPLLGAAAAPISLATAVLPAGAEFLHRFGQAATNREVKDLQALIRDPAGKGIKADPQTIAEARRKLAELASKAYRTGASAREKE